MTHGESGTARSAARRLDSFEQRCELTRRVATTLRVMPDSKDQTLVARVDLAPRPSNPSALYEAIPKRHTNRAAYIRQGRFRSSH